MIRVIVISLSLLFMIPGAQAQIVQDTSGSDMSTYVASVKRELSHLVATQYKTLAPQLLESAKKNDMTLPLNDIRGNVMLRKDMKALDQNLRQSKGIAQYVDSLVEIRLAHSNMVSDLEDGEEPLFAYEPAGDEGEWFNIEAFDSEGNVHYLSVDEMPSRPVFVIDINAKKDLAAGIKLMNGVFKQQPAGKVLAPTSPSSPALSHAAPAKASVLVLRKVHLWNDQEPWISGAAEVYSIITGLDPSSHGGKGNSKAALYINDMPYLDHDKRNYYPDQVHAFWADYKFGALDMTFMEHDDGTNYRDLAVNLLKVAQNIAMMLNEPTASAIITITSAILNALPSHWFVNDDDYLDSVYTVQQGRSYVNRVGAAGNATVILETWQLGR